MNDAREAVSAFIDTCKAKDGVGWAYSTGYLGSMLERLIMNLPKAQRDLEILQLRIQTQNLQHERTLNALKN